MLVFVIPVKSREIANSWDILSKLFDRCIRSVCSQTSSNFKVVVVCNQKPKTQFNHPAVEYIEVNFPAPIRERLSLNADKKKKIVSGLEYAKKFQPSHIMVVDADDCVSKHLVEFVDSHPQSNGWFINQGYVYEDGKRIIFLKWRAFHQVCGTSVIIKPELFSHLLKNPNFYDHNIANLLEGEQLLKPLPFIGAVYTIKNGENLFMSNETIQKTIINQNPIFFLVGKLLKYVPLILTNSIYNEFGLYKID